MVWDAYQIWEQIKRSKFVISFTTLCFFFKFGDYGTLWVKDILLRRPNVFDL
jgi:hypothetical protein